MKKLLFLLCLVLYLSSVSQNYPEGEEITMDGEFKDGKLWNGRHYIYDTDGLLIKIDVYKEGKYVGNGVIGDNEEIQTDTTNQINKDGKKSGYWRITGEMSKKHGYANTAVVEEGYYKQSRKTGNWKKYWPNGNVKNEIEYLNGRPYGKYTTYYESGQVEEKGNWPIWKLGGETWRFYKSGCLSRFSINDTHSLQVNTFYFDDCNLTLSIKGTIEKDSDTIYRPERNSDWNWKGGNRPTEKITYWDSAGNIILHESIPSDTTKKIQPPKYYKDGYHKIYDKNANIWLDGEFKGGKLYNGKHYIYDENGLLDRIEIYKKGKYFANGVIDTSVINPTESIDSPSLPNNNHRPAYKINGYNKVYNENDEIWLDGEFKRAHLYNGKCYIYDEDGILEKIEIYKKGKFVRNGVL